jgi:hypothetical protein
MSNEDILRLRELQEMESDGVTMLPGEAAELSKLSREWYEDEQNRP